MCDIEVAAEHHGPGLFELLQICEEIRIPSHTVVEPGEAALGIWCIYIYEGEQGELEGDDPTLTVVLGHAHAEGDRAGLDPGEDGGSGVSLLGCVVPVLSVAREARL